MQAASGVGEPFVSAAGILGVMVIWRSFYAAFLDWSVFTSIGYSGAKQEKEAERFVEAIRLVIGIASVGATIFIACSLLSPPSQL